MQILYYHKRGGSPLLFDFQFGKKSGQKKLRLLGYWFVQMFCCLHMRVSYCRGWVSLSLSARSARLANANQQIPQLLSFVLSFQKRKYIKETSFRKVLATYSVFFVAGKRGKRHIARVVSNIKFPAGKCVKKFYKKRKNIWKRVGIYDIIVAVIFFPKGCL